MFELWEAMCQVCVHGAVPLGDKEDVEPADQLFHLYSAGRLRFENPPCREVEMPWRDSEVAATGASSPASLAKASGAPSCAASSSLVRQRAAVAIGASTGLIAELTNAELMSLSTAMATAKDPGQNLQLTERDVRFMEGEDIEEELSGDVYTDEEEEEEGDEEG